MKRNNLTMFYKSKMGQEYELTYDSEVYVDRYYPMIPQTDITIDITRIANIDKDIILDWKKVFKRPIFNKLTEYIENNHDESMYDDRDYEKRNMKIVDEKFGGGL